MSSINKVILVGNLGKDPEIKHLENERTLAKFSLATNEIHKNKTGEKVTTTTWHNVVLWTPLAEIAEKYLSKGRQIYVEGKLTHRSYVDKEGQTKYVSEVVGQNLLLLGGNKDSIAVNTEENNDLSNESSDGLPF